MFYDFYMCFVLVSIENVQKKVNLRDFFRSSCLWEFGAPEIEIQSVNPFLSRE